MSEPKIEVPVKVKQTPGKCTNCGKHLVGSFGNVCFECMVSTYGDESC